MLNRHDDSVEKQWELPLPCLASRNSDEALCIRFSAPSYHSLVMLSVFVSLTRTLVTDYHSSVISKAYLGCFPVALVVGILMQRARMARAARVISSTLSLGGSLFAAHMTGAPTVTLAGTTCLMVAMCVGGELMTRRFPAQSSEDGRAATRSRRRRRGRGRGGGASTVKT